MKRKHNGKALLLTCSLGLALGSMLLLDRLATGPSGDGAAPPSGRVTTGPSGTAPADGGFNMLADVPAGPFGPIVSEAVAHGSSLPLQALPPAYLMPHTPRVEEERGPVRPPRAVDPAFVDPVWQRAFDPLAAAMPAPIGTFDGQDVDDSGCGCIPPDTTGAVGPTQYVQIINATAVAVYRKDGTTQVAPRLLSTLFSSLPSGNVCRTRNNGDPIVLYDQLADRWLLSQFSVPGGAQGYHECVAISQTGDAGGAYYVYDFLVGGSNRFHDYPHFGLWPDAYYMSTHEFNPSSYVGSGVFAFERTKMLLGLNARIVFFDLAGVDSRFFGHLPASLEGKTLPPAGAPNYFAEVDDNAEIAGPGGSDAMRIWKFHVDWANTANSTYGLSGQPNFVVPVANFSRSACDVGVTQAVCVPQPGSEVQLDVLGDRLMYRLVYRNFGTHESLAANHTVVANGNTNQHGVRWYEIRDPGGAPTVFQQGTLAPTGTTDPLHRWMGSIAMDKDGNIVLGYSTSSNSDFPSIAYSGRLVSDPPGTLAQTETQMFPGGASQNPFLFVTPRGGRWGDYSHMSVDPADDSTFWYTNEYYPTPVDAFTTWHTRIGHFKFGPVVALTAPTLSLGPDYQNPDPDGTFTLNWTHPTGATGPDLLQASSSCAPFLTDDASAIAPKWTATADDGTVGPKWQLSSAKPQHQGNSTFWAQVQNEDGAILAGPVSARLTYNSPIALPATGITTLKFSEFYFNEDPDTGFQGDIGFVEVSTNGGSTWTQVYANQRPMGATPDDGASAYANDDLTPTEVNLSAYAGQTIRLRFRFLQDSPDYFFFVQYGWYLDDISLNNDDWGDLLTTSGTSYTRSQPNGTQCYRVRTSYDVNGQTVASPFSNIVNATVSLTDIPPVARLTGAPTSGNSPLAVNFDGSTSTDSDNAIVEYTFNFGDGTPAVTRTVASFGAAAAMTSHSYANIGSYPATLVVKDAPGVSSAVSTPVVIDVLDRAPVAQLTADPTTGDSPLSVSFDASASSDADSGDSIVSYTFDFGDGSGPVSQPAATRSHTYASQGTYDATLTVTDSHGMASAPVTVQIVVNPGPPVPQLSASPTPVAKGDPVAFDASASSGDDIVDFTFDFGDGSAPVTQAGATISHTYLLGGSYGATLAVRDTQDVVRTTTRTITVLNAAPVAALSADATEGEPPFTVNFDASGSSDPDSAKTTDHVDRYDFDYGDGVVETVTVPSASHTYTTPGTYDARLTVFDAEGKASAAAALVQITVLNGTPVAVISADKTSGFAPLTVTFDGAGSSDPDGGDSVVSYRFDFGDGSEPVTRVGASSVQHIYPDPGPYTATLVVQDSHGAASAPATLDVDVGPVNRAPIARVSADKLSGTAPLAVAFDAGASSDADGDAVTEYAFDFGDGTPAVTRTVADFGAQAARTTHTYQSAGRYPGFVTVKDARGATSSNSDQITITATTPLGENTTVPEIKDEKGPFSGALSPWMLLILALAARRPGRSTITRKQPTTEK